MRKETRIAFNAYLARLAELNGVPSAAEQFAVDPTIEQILETKIQESSAFLSAINVIGVRDLAGKKVGLGIGSTIAGTTDTSSADRATTDPTDTTERDYLCTKTNFDTHVDYAKLDAWSKFPDFQTRMRDLILRRIGLDRMVIGWNGTSRAATSDRATNPLLQDVAIGWFQDNRANNAARVMDEVVGASGVVNVGILANETKGDYTNLDALVFDVVNSLLEPWFRESTDLRVILGRELMAEKYFPLISDHAGTPTESRAMDMMLSSMRIGGLQGVRVPYFPSRALVVTSLDNLSIYFQEGSRRRTIVDNAKRDRIEDYNSVNEDYVTEDYGAFAAVENIQLPNAAGSAFA